MIFYWECGMVSCSWHDCLVHKWIILLIHICMKKKGVLWLEAWSIDSKPYQMSVAHHFWTGLLWSRSCYKNGIIQFTLAIWWIQARMLYYVLDRVQGCLPYCFRGRGSAAPEEAIGKASAYPIVLSCTSLTSDVLFFCDQNSWETMSAGVTKLHSMQSTCILDHPWHTPKRISAVTSLTLTCMAGTWRHASSHF